MHNLSLKSFFALTFILSWSCWIPFTILGPPAKEVVAGGTASQSPWLLLHLLGKYGPSLAAILTAHFSGEKGQIRALLSPVLQWKLNGYWYLLAILLPLSIIVLLWLAGWYRVDVHPIRLLTGFFSFIFISGLGEEVGWRGLALKKLLKGRSVLSAGMLVGIVWGIWHLPIVIWASSQRGLAFVGELILYLMVIAAFSVMMATIFVRTRQSLFLMILMHTLITSVYNQAMLQISPAQTGTWFPIIFCTLTVSMLATLTYIALERFTVANGETFAKTK